MARQQFEVTFSTHQGALIHTATVDCAFAHNAPKVAARLLETADPKAYKEVLRFGLRVSVVAIQGELGVNDVSA